MLGVMDIMGALYSTTVFMGISNCLTILPVINADRAVFYRERAAGMFHVFPYVLSQGLAEMPYLAVQVRACVVELRSGDGAKGETRVSVHSMQAGGVAVWDGRGRQQARGGHDPTAWRMSITFTSSPV